MARSMAGFIFQRVAAVVFLALAPAASVYAEDTLKVAIGAGGTFADQVSEVGRDQGIFKKHGLSLEVARTQGGGETLSAVTAGTADVGVAAGTLAALRAFAKGAPIRLIGSAGIGAQEFWYVAARSPIKSLKDTASKSVAYSTTGSATNLMVLAFQELYGAKLKPVATGDPVATLAQVLSGRIDVGYSLPPAAVAELADGKIRAVGRANDLPALAKQTVRFIVANADALAKHPDAFRRFMQGYRDTVEWLFSSDPQAVAAYAKWAGVSEAVARRSRDEFVAKDNMLPDRIGGLETILADAVTYKFIDAPLTADQLKTLIQLQEPIR